MVKWMYRETFSRSRHELKASPLLRCNCLTFCLSLSPLWSSDQNFCLQIQRSRVRFPALPVFLRSNWPGTGSTQHEEDKWGATWKKTEIKDLGDQPPWPRNTPLSTKVDTNFADKRLPFGRYSLLEDKKLRSLFDCAFLVRALCPCLWLSLHNGLYRVCREFVGLLEHFAVEGMKCAKYTKIISATGRGCQ
jgi:hypothetical protein